MKWSPLRCVLTDSDKNTPEVVKGLVGQFIKLAHMEVFNACNHFKFLEIEAGIHRLPNSMGL